MAALAAAVRSVCSHTPVASPPGPGAPKFLSATSAVTSALAAIMARAPAPPSLFIEAMPSGPCDSTASVSVVAGAADVGARANRARTTTGFQAMNVMLRSSAPAPYLASWPSRGNSMAASTSVGKQELSPVAAGSRHSMRIAIAGRSPLGGTFATRIFDCACGGRRQVVAFVTDTAKAVEILEELGLPVEAPKLTRARGPPRQEELFERPVGEFTADPVY